jgi:hypothetical protein
MHVSSPMYARIEYRSRHMIQPVDLKRVALPREEEEDVTGKDQNRGRVLYNQNHVRVVGGFLY